MIFSVIWLRFCVFISSEKVSFVGVRGNSSLGDISLDEVSVSDAEECKTSGPKQGDVGPNPKEGEYAIYSGDGQTELFFVERCRISPNGLMQSVFSAHVNTTPCHATPRHMRHHDSLPGHQTVPIRGGLTCVSCCKAPKVSTTSNKAVSGQACCFTPLKPQ